MTRNQKIALGCGGAGCLGLIVVAVASVLIYYFAYRAAPYRDYNFNTSTNRNDNSNDNSDLTTNRNDNGNDNSSNTNSSSSAVSSMSEDDKHKLYQAAVQSGDQELVRRVSVKLGLMDEDYTPGDNYTTFVRAHVTWVFSNTDFVKSLDTPAKARAYVDENFPN